MRYDILILQGESFNVSPRIRLYIFWKIFSYLVQMCHNIILYNSYYISYNILHKYIGSIYIKQVLIYRQGHMLAFYSEYILGLCIIHTYI